MTTLDERLGRANARLPGNRPAIYALPPTDLARSRSAPPDERRGSPLVTHINALFRRLPTRSKTIVAHVFRGHELRTPLLGVKVPPRWRS